LQQVERIQKRLQMPYSGHDLGDRWENPREPLYVYWKVKPYPAEQAMTCSVGYGFTFDLLSQVRLYLPIVSTRELGGSGLDSPRGAYFSTGRR